jgi:hypothetical protein
MGSERPRTHAPKERQLASDNLLDRSLDRCSGLSSCEVRKPRRRDPVERVPLAQSLVVAALLAVAGAAMVANLSHALPYALAAALVQAVSRIQSRLLGLKSIS